jgi:DNA-binding response OmpR family regulator/nitrogen-specific signal transduction histidine kinase
MDQPGGDRQHGYSNAAFCDFHTTSTLLLAELNEALLDETQPLPDAQRERLALARQNAERLFELADSLFDATAVAQPSSRSPEVTANVAEELSDAHILIVDDEADLRRYLERLLSKHWHVTTAANGKLALQAARETFFDLILSDVMMPEMDGIALVQTLRSDPDLQTVPIILISACGTEESRLAGLQRGADDFLVKPFSARELVARVEAQLRSSRQRRLAAENALLVRLHNVGADLLEKRAMPELLQAAVDAAVALTGASLGDLQLYDDEADVLQLAAQRGFNAELAEHLRIVERCSSSAFAEVLRSGQRCILEDIASDTGAPAASDASHLRAAGVRSLQATPITSRAGTLIGVLSTFWKLPHRPDNAMLRILDLLTRQIADLIQHRRAEQALKRTESALRDANRRKDEFISILGHELRNPLSPILTSLDLMDLQGGGLFQLERDTIRRQVRYMVRLIDDLLEVSRLTLGKVSLQQNPEDMQGILAEAMELVSPLLEQRGHHVSVDIAPQLVVMADRTRLAQVFANLLSNAAKFTPMGGSIQVRADRDGGQVRVVVEDNGVGIRAEMLTSIFDTFVQETQALDRSQGGLGLGLSIVRALVALHGGSVEAHSDGAMKGSRFIVRLPATTVPRSRARSAATRVYSPPATPGRQVLIVDDNHDAAESLASALAALGHTVEVAYDGPAALEKLRHFTPDVALLDIGLPVMDGYELAQRIRRERGSTTRLLAITGYAQERDRERAAEAGFDAHLVKPVDLAMLRGALERDLSSS